MVEQAQLELQKDIQATQENSRKDCKQLSKEINHCSTQQCPEQPLQGYNWK